MLLLTAPSCPFSAAFAPTFTALAAVFPQLQAWQVDGWGDYRLDARFGVRSFPALLLLKGPSLVRALRERSLAELTAKVANLTGGTPLTRNTTTLAFRDPYASSSRPFFLDPAAGEVRGSNW
jgi:hypothetical protein